jgi:hypothetical protein
MSLLGDSVPDDPDEDDTEDDSEEELAHLVAELKQLVKEADALGIACKCSL